MGAFRNMIYRKCKRSSTFPNSEDKTLQLGNDKPCAVYSSRAKILSLTPPNGNIPKIQTSNIWEKKNQVDLSNISFTFIDDLISSLPSSGIGNEDPFEPIR